VGDPLHAYSLKPVAATAVITGTGSSTVTVSIAITADDIENWKHLDHQVLTTMRHLVDGNMQLEDMVAVGSIRGTFFNLRLTEGESVEEHVQNLDYALILSNSLPRSWDAFRQTLQPDLNGLRIRVDCKNITRVIRSKVLLRVPGVRRNPGRSVCTATRSGTWNQNAGLRQKPIKRRKPACSQRQTPQRRCRQRRPTMPKKFSMLPVPFSPTHLPLTIRQ